MLSQTVIQTITVLQGVRAEKEAYIHLYLVLLLLVFPLIVASDDELPVVAKSKLRHILNTCAAEVESVILNSAFFDLTSLSSFTKALKKMVSLNEMTSCTIKANCTDRALKQSMSYVESVANSIEDKFTGRSNLEQICVEAIVKPINAYNFTLIDETSAKDYHDATEIISTLAKALAENVISAKDRMMMLPQIARTKEVGGGMAQDLPYQLFKISSEKFHEITADPLFLKLPVPIITPAVIHLISSMQYGHFQNTGLHDTELAEETSKCWWYFCCMIQEYVGIISEVVTLSQAVAQW
ncbi:hypothetical protein JCM33374_g5196 [Metschnikowia sp. JCM 33374]|nr:hypothetical protein JCM33374_g5196 [Metschnikowia sp. JCM 33374]